MGRSRVLPTSGASAMARCRRLSVAKEDTDVMDGGESDRIALSIPAQPRLLQLVRLTAGVVAAGADLELNDVEDLRLAVDELCLPFMGTTGHPGRLLVRYGWDGETIEISCTLTAGDEGTDAGTTQTSDLSVSERPIRGQAERLRDELSSQILDALVDEHGETTLEGRAVVWLRMHRPPRPAG
jgi:hypothetical protein